MEHEPKAETAEAFRIGVSDYLRPPFEAEHAAFPEAEFVALEDWRASAAARAEWESIDALLAWNRPIDAETVALMRRCRIVVRYGVGFDAVDLEALEARGVPLANTPSAGIEEVADTACAMILALQRQIFAHDRASRATRQGWQENLIRPTHRTATRTAGLIGVGRIGTATALRLKAFGMRVVGYDPYVPAGHEKGVGYERMESLDDLLANADVVSLHCPLTPETRGMVDREFFGRMRPGAFFVNTARGAILRSLEALDEALRSGRVGAAALDVLPEEPPRGGALLEAWRRDEERLRGRLIINPHAAFFSEEGFVEMRRRAAETARLFLVEGRLRNRVRP